MTRFTRIALVTAAIAAAGTGLVAAQQSGSSCNDHVERLTQAFAQNRPALDMDPRPFRNWSDNYGPGVAAYQVVASLQRDR